MNPLFQHLIARLVGPWQRKSAVTVLIVIVNASVLAQAQQLIFNHQPSQLDIRAAGESSIRITIKPLNYKGDVPIVQALDHKKYASPILSLRSISRPIKKNVGGITVELVPEPLKIIISNKEGQLVQRIVLQRDGNVAFNVGSGPILGLGEGGPKSSTEDHWRDEKVQFDRRHSYDSMRPRWQAGMYGSRNPVPMLIGTEGWGIFVASPWVEVDLRDDSTGYLIPWRPSDNEKIPQNVKDQGQNRGKGLPPIDQIIPGVFDFFVLNAHDPAEMMKDISSICGQAALPPKWALGYMQSHRTLVNEQQVIGIVDTFRRKKIPLDAVIYLGTGFTPSGWNTQQPSFTFNPNIFKRSPEAFFSDMHQRNAKVVLHMVPWDRDKLPTLQGSIPPKKDEELSASHIMNYWRQHEPLVKAGIDGWWPDEGDWFNLFERLKRHQLYYEGPIASQPDRRPWSLHRNGFLGISKWGGWVWSGDTDSSWKTLEAQIATGINHSLSLSPFWGSDIGGFFPNEELTGELYARWFQFGAFNPSFRSHGRTWWTRLPWGWGLSDMGPKEGKRYPLQSEMNNTAIEPVVKKYDEIRYMLLPYNYTLAWETRATGLPMMRALWLHYPQDTIARRTADEFLWGRDLLIAPIYEKGARDRNVYLPEGQWYDWWTNEVEAGGKFTRRKVDLGIMPIYVRAGAIIPVDPVRQYTGEDPAGPTTLKIYTGQNGSYTLYDDDGISLDYLKGKFTLTTIDWLDKEKKLTIQQKSGDKSEKKFIIELVPQGLKREVAFKGKAVEIAF